MKKLFLMCVDIARTIQTIRWVDMDKGQINRYEDRPPVAFPCMLVKIDYVRCENLGGKKQKCLVRITLRLAWDYVGETDFTMPEAAVQRSLQYIDLVDTVYKKFQGFNNEVVAAPLNRVSQLEENRPDGLKVVNMVFETYIHDFSASA